MLTDWHLSAFPKQFLAKCSVQKSLFYLWQSVRLNLTARFSIATWWLLISRSYKSAVDLLQAHAHDY